MGSWIIVDYEIEKFTVWIFYLKSKPKQIYAYTAAKEYKKLFLQLRNPNMFYVEKIIMDEFEFSMFLNANRYNKIDRYPMVATLSDEGSYIEVASTIYEQDLCTQKYNQLEHEMEDIYRELIVNSSIKEKYKKEILFLLDRNFKLKYPGGEQLTSRCNEFMIFMKLFGNTFRDPDKV